MVANLARKADGSAVFVNALVKPEDRSAWWDGQGKYNVRGAMTPAQALKKVGSFHVTKRPLLVDVGGKHVLIPDFVANVRDDTKVVLGIVNADFPNMQNDEAVDLAYTIIGEGALEHGARRKPRILTLGALGTGSKWFTTISLNAFDLKVKRDPSRHEANLIVQWGFDGLTAIRASLWDLRVVCQNTSQAADAYGERSGTLVRIVHSGDMAAKVVEARRVLGFAEREVKRHVAVMNALADAPLPGGAKLDKWLTTFGTILIPIPPEMERTAGREEARAAVLGLCKSSKSLEGVPMSAYRVFQAVTEYADHYRPVRTKSDIGEKRASLAFGAADDVKARAMDILRRAFLDDGATGALVPVPVLARTSSN